MGVVEIMAILVQVITLTVVRTAAAQQLELFPQIVVCSTAVVALPQGVSETTSRPVLTTGLRFRLNNTVDARSEREIRAAAIEAR
jgi:hypothetical protein